MNPFIHCVTCNIIFHKTPYDQVPEYEWGAKESPDLARTIEKDDYQDFLQDHRGHRLEELQIVEGSFMGTGDYREPVRTSYWKATNGRERFVIKGSRQSIRDPLRYQLIRGDYQVKCISLEIQSREITRQLEIEFGANPLSQEKITALLHLLQEIIQGLDAGHLERVPEESLNPLEIYYRMSDVHTAFLLRRCRKIFNREEFEVIQEFVHHHREDGVLLLRGKHQIQMMEVARAEDEVIEATVSAEKERLAKKQ
jgi:hypothetical protein